MNWTVDYGEGEKPVDLPHVWHLDRPVWWEGPAVYRCRLDAAPADTWLVVHGASYACKVSVNGNIACDHLGIWDAFSVPLPEGVPLVLELSVTKNGGETFPVTESLAGFLPYVYHTFGGLFREVEIIQSKTDPVLTRQMCSQRIAVASNKLSLDGKPFYMRGILSWGWNPKTANPHAADGEIRKELAAIREAGFNTVKFCLWLPSHLHLDLLAEYGLVAWIELPLWMPSASQDFLARAELELKRIVLQYRHHDSIIVWTLGCELSESTPVEFRERMVKFISEQTGCPLVRDNSGGAEMYGGDLREFATFRDFHPYCDTPHYRPVLHELAELTDQPILLGEFNDYDHARLFPDLKQDIPYYLRDDRDLNDQGVRWQHDFPALLGRQLAPRDYASLRRYSISKGHYIKRKVIENVRSISAISGYVVTGLRDTPISTSGILDDQDQMVYGSQHTTMWNGPVQLFLQPSRLPPWVAGGNQPGWRDPQSAFTGEVYSQLGVHSEADLSGQATLGFVGGLKTIMDQAVKANAPQLVVTHSATLAAGKHLLAGEFAGSKATWPVWVFDRFDASGATAMRGVADIYFDQAVSSQPQRELFVGTWAEFCGLYNPERPFVAIITSGAESGPFWRECVFDYSHPGALPFANRWELLFCVSGDQWLNEAQLDQIRGQSLMTRIDTRTYRETSCLSTAKKNGQSGIVTTLRPWGGLGSQPNGYKNNPAGHGLMACLYRLLGQNGSTGSHES